jgi:REP element-mobilizing transposase RayT
LAGNPKKYSVSWIAKRIKGRGSNLLRDRFQQLKEWRPGHLWAPSCYHKTFKKSFIKKHFAIGGAWLGSGGEIKPVI